VNLERDVIKYMTFPPKTGPFKMRKKWLYFDFERTKQMKKSRFTEQQIAYALRQAESGVSIQEITRKMAVTEATFYRWKKKFAGMGIAELRRLKQLEGENKKLKRLVADLSLDKAMLQDVLSKKV